MPKRQELKVVKLPNKGAILSKPQVFPRMPRLYLELIENKDKIKQDLVNKEHIPFEQRVPEERVSEERVSEERVSEESKNFEKRIDKLLDEDDSVSMKSLKNEPIEDDNESVFSSVSELSIEEKDDKSEVSDNLSVKLKRLLNDDSESVVVQQPRNDSSYKERSSDKYSRHRDREGHAISPPVVNRYVPAAPSLAELEASGGFVPKKEFPDINQNQYDEQKEDDAKRELLFKFDLLRKSYPLASSIPEYNIHTDLTLLEKSYSDCVRRLSLDSTVENYKTYLVYGFMGCEFIFGNFLGFDMQGFTQQQIVSMHSYEKLLIELGEKSYVPTGSNWPVEVRLLFMIIMNAAFFIISKMLMKKTGANLMGMINGMSSPKTPTSQPSQKRKMKGPNIDLEDIPEI